MDITVGLVYNVYIQIRKKRSFFVCLYILFKTDILGYINAMTTITFVELYSSGGSVGLFVTPERCPKVKTYKMLLSNEIFCFDTKTTFSL